MHKYSLCIRVFIRHFATRMLSKGGASKSREEYFDVFIMGAMAIRLRDRRIRSDRGI